MRRHPGTPPTWMTRFIEWYCKPQYAEDLLGDLHEYYERNLSKSKVWADLNYMLDMVKFFRPYLVRKANLNNRLINMYLLHNYFKTAVRSIRRNKLFSGINLFGLGISMTVCLLMIAYIAELLSYDSFHTKRDRIYRINNTYESITGSFDSKFASTSILTGNKMREEVSGLEEVVIIRKNFSDDLRKGDNAISIGGYYTENEFWKIFSFRLIHGDAENLLSSQESLVLSQTAAQKLFGDENPVGQIIEGSKGNYTITGVFEDVPTNSHMRFEALAPLSKILAKHAQEDDHEFLGWRNMWSNYVYFLLPENGNIQSIQESLNKIAEVENTQSDRYNITLSVENMNDFVPGEDKSNEIGPNFGWKIVYLLSGLTLIVMISACFNYTNLSIARSLRRSKEVGVRKVIGANRSQVIMQFLTEAVVITLLSLILSWALFFFIRPQFISLFGESDISLKINNSVILASFIFAILTGFLAGLLPAIFLSKLKAISIIRDITTKKVFKGVNLRRVLIVFQLTLSMAFVIATVIAYQQYKYSVNFDLGYRTDNIINIKLQGNDHQLLSNELEKIPEISKISNSTMIMSVGTIWTERFFYKDPLDSADMCINYIDPAFTEVHDFEFVAGGTFPYALGDGDSAQFIIVDRQTLERFQIEDPYQAIGERLAMSIDGEKRPFEIVGVIEDFQYGTINNDKRPVIFLQGGDIEDFYYANVLANTSEPIVLMDKIDKAFRTLDDLHPLQAKFYDEDIDRAYEDFSKTFQIFSFLTTLAITIALMGFMGIAVFSMETRIKEISVRKILGATEKQLVALLSRGFLWMILIAAGLATPLTYLLFANVILENFANRTPIGPADLMSGGLIILTFAVPIVVWQTVKAARSNPAETLRND